MAIDESLRSRLEALNRGALPGVGSRPAPRTAAEAASPTGAAASPTRAAAQAKAAWRAGAVRALPGLLRRGEAAATDAGEHWRIVLAVDELWPGGEQLVQRRHESLLAGAAPPPSKVDEGPRRRGARGGISLLDDFIAAFPERACFLDLETCGLAGSALFLAGLLRQIDGRLAVELLLARDYSEEAAVLASLWQRLAGAAALITFNGKSFDWPMILDRSRRHRLACTPASPPRHVDLLHAARRRWRRELPDCKLQTLERRVCGRERAGDLPGSQIPAAYRQYVLTGFEREMDAILLHNAIDLVTMLDLAMRLSG